MIHEAYSRGKLIHLFTAMYINILQALLDPKVEARIVGATFTSPAVGVEPSHPILVVRTHSLLHPSIYTYIHSDMFIYIRICKEFNDHALTV